MLKTALNTNIIPHIWKLANIVPIPKPNKDRHRQGHFIQTHITHLSNCKDTGEEPYFLHNRKHTNHTQATRIQNTTLYSDGATHSKNTVQRGSTKWLLHARTITVALDMSKAFDTINMHTLIRKLLQTNIPCTLIKFIANYTKGHKAYTTYRNHTSSKRQFKAGVTQGCVLSPTLFNIYTADIPPPRAAVQVMAYADDITITSFLDIYHRPKPHIQHTHSQHLSTSTQTTTNDKQTHRMG